MGMGVQKEDHLGMGRILYLSGQEGLDILVMVNPSVVSMRIENLKTVMAVMLLLKGVMLMSMAMRVDIRIQLNIRVSVLAGALVEAEWVSRHQTRWLSLNMLSFLHLILNIST